MKQPRDGVRERAKVNSLFSISFDFHLISEKWKIRTTSTSKIFRIDVKSKESEKQIGKLHNTHIIYTQMASN